MQSFLERSDKWYLARTSQEAVVRGCPVEQLCSLVFFESRRNLEKTDGYQPNPLEGSDEKKVTKCSIVAKKERLWKALGEEGEKRK